MVVEIKPKNDFESYISFTKNDLGLYAKYTACLEQETEVHYFDQKALSWVCDTGSAEKIQALFEYPEPDNLLKLKPYKYQQQGIQFCLRTPGSLLQLPCGAGKSLMGICILLELRAGEKTNKPGVFVVKASLKNQWSDEVEKFSDLKPTIIQTYAAITHNIRHKIRKRKKKLEELISDGAIDHREEISEITEEIENLEDEAYTIFENQFDGDALILNYETFRDQEVREKLEKIKPDFFFIDEIDSIKDNHTQKAQLLYIYNNASYKYGATATPIRKNPKDLYGIFSFLQPDLFSSERAFENTYLKFYYGRIVGSKNEEILSEKIAPFIFRKTYEEISDQLPTQTVIQRYCDFTKKQMAMNDRLMNEIADLKEQEEALAARYSVEILRTLEAYQKLEDNIVARQTFAQMLADSEELLEASESNLAKTYLTGSESSKVELCLELVMQIVESGEKVVIFSKYLKMQEILKERIESIMSVVGEPCKIAQIMGSTNTEKRNEIIKAFNQEDNYKILLASDAAEAGINIPAAKYMIEFELAESAAKQTQRHGRIQRADSLHRSVFVYQLICRGSFDEIAIKIVNKKEKYAKNIL